MWLSLKTGVFQKSLIPLWFLLAVLAAFDIGNRINNNKAEVNSTWQLEPLNEKLTINLDNDQANEIITAINQYELTQLDEEQPANIMSDADQNNQKGNLDEFYSGELRYRLIGVFDKNERFAVLKEFNVSTNQNTLKKITKFERIKNYQVTDILANTLILQSEDDRIITLFLYKTNK